MLPDMRVALTKEFTLDSAHRLPCVPPDHKCARLHGHTFRCVIEVTGEVDPATGWLVDYGDILAACQPVRDALDHRLLNEVPGLENPTSETLARWIWDRLKPALPLLSAVTIRETCTVSCTYRGP